MATDPSIYLSTCSRRRLRRGRRRLPPAVAVVLVAGLAAGTWSAVSTAKPKILIEVSGRPVGVPAGSTLAQAARRLGLAPRPGNLIDVEGQVVRRGAVAGVLLLNGRPAPGGTVLRSGDRIGARGARDRVEPHTRTVEQVARAQVSNPQFFVELVRGRSVVLRGAVSHKLVSTRFVPEGPPYPDRAVALTFDDGPSQYTARFLDVLEELNVPATFFVIGTQVEELPEIVRREVAAGMAVGNHSYDHPWRTPFAELPAATIRAEVAKGRSALEGIGVRSVLFRPPGGTVSPLVLRAAAAGGSRVVLWSVDARDWVEGTTAEQIVDRVLGTVRAGSVVVMHDGGGNREATLEALPAIVDGIRRRGLRLVALAPTG